MVEMATEMEMMGDGEAAEMGMGMGNEMARWRWRWRRRWRWRWRWLCVVTCDHHHPHIIRWLKSDAVVNEKSESGTTAITAVFHGQDDVYVANVGDSRAVLVHSDGTVTPLSTDHRPAINEAERQRVNASPLGND